MVSFGSTILEIYFGRKLAVSSYNQLTVNHFHAVNSTALVYFILTISWSLSSIPTHICVNNAKLYYLRRTISPHGDSRSRIGRTCPRTIVRPILRSNSSKRQYDQSNFVTPTFPYGRPYECFYGIMRNRTTTDVFGPTHDRDDVANS